MGYSPSTTAMSAVSAGSLTYASLSYIKTQLGISGSGEDTKLTQMGLQAEEIFERETGRKFVAAAYTHYFDGNGEFDLVLRQYPVNSITSIHEDGDGRYGASADPFPASTLLTAGTDYALDALDGSTSYSGIVQRIGARWANKRIAGRSEVSHLEMNRRGNIKVIYNAGYSTIPTDISMAICNIVAMTRKSAAGGMPISGFSLDYFSVQYAQSAEAIARLDSATRIINRYKRPSF
jgi:hypothetical protein